MLLPWRLDDQRQWTVMSRRRGKLASQHGGAHALLALVRSNRPSGEIYSLKCLLQISLN